MKVGGLRLISIPPQFAYGERGKMPLIPPNAVIDMAVSLLSVKRVGTNPNSMLDPNAQKYVRARAAGVARAAYLANSALCSSPGTDHPSGRSLFRWPVQ